VANVEAAKLRGLTDVVKYQAEVLITCCDVRDLDEANIVAVVEPDLLKMKEFRPKEPASVLSAEFSSTNRF